MYTTMVSHRRRKPAARWRLCDGTSPGCDAQVTARASQPVWLMWLWVESQAVPCGRLVPSHTHLRHDSLRSLYLRSPRLWLAYQPHQPCLPSSQTQPAGRTRSMQTQPYPQHSTVTVSDRPSHVRLTDYRPRRSPRQPARADPAGQVPGMQPAAPPRCP